MVPTHGDSLPNVMEDIIRSADLDLSNLCYFTLCPMVTYGHLLASERRGMSRVEDFPFMDGGSGSEPQATESHGNMTRDFDPDYCTEGGFANNYPKSIAVVRNVYKGSLHYPGACNHPSYWVASMKPYVVE